MLTVVHNYYYLLTLLIIHSFRTSICVCKYLCMLSVTFDHRGGAGLMTLKFYIFSAEIAIPLRLMLIPVFHPGLGRPNQTPLQGLNFYLGRKKNILLRIARTTMLHCPIFKFDLHFFLIFKIFLVKNLSKFLTIYIRIINNFFFNMPTTICCEVFAVANVIYFTPL